MKRFTLLSLLGLIFSVQAIASDFAVDDIRIEGLQQVDPAIVFRNFPINRGDLVDQRALNDATKDLFESGYFDDVELLKDQGVLIVRVKERPSVALIRLEGNDMLKDEQLMGALEQAGVQEGDIFRRAALDKIRLELLRVYNEAGRYTAEVTTEVEQLESNRVAINVEITEGQTAVIQKINIIGNTVFSDEELLDLFDSGLTNYLSWWTDNDKYAKERLSADIERMTSFYLDRGYLKFNVDSTDVSISPDQKQIFITIAITEGELFTLSDVKVAGDIAEYAQELNAALLVSKGDTYSKKLSTYTQSLIRNIVSAYGYLNARVIVIPEEKGNNAVDLTFFVEPGELTYVRRIEIRGNSTTADEVIRRVIPQLEGAVAIGVNIKRAKEELDKTGFFSKVSIGTKPVLGAEDQIDIVVDVEEGLLGQISAGVGYSSSDGVGYQAAFQQDNFLGSGTSINASFDMSDVVTSFSVAYENPYYTLDGVGRGFSLYASQKDYSAADISDYDVNSFGGDINFSYPIDAYQRLRFGFGLDQTDLALGIAPQNYVTDFVRTEGFEYLTYKITGSWVSNRLNRAMFPSKGGYQSFSAEVALPGGDLSFAKATYTGKYYYPFDRQETFVGALRTRVGYADSIDGGNYPFFENYFVGGLTSVRGYAANTIGPKEGTSVIGGNGLFSGSAEFIFPMPFVEDKDSWRTLFFLDGGSVYQDDPSFDDMRYSAGIGISWITPIGPLSISSAKALNASSDDTEEQVQFAIGRMF
jgi:outer membrane protein insertion porin family